MSGKGRRSWSTEEDQLLRYAVEREDPGSPNPSKWCAIAKHVPNRSNRDCRKRWMSNMAFRIVKGTWSPDEDARLVNAYERFGSRWSLVSMAVKSRNSDQCAKRWCDILDPSINRARWTPAEDDKLLQAVEQHGTAWAKIARVNFPGRTGLAAKNRYHSILRFRGAQDSGSTSSASTSRRGSACSTSTEGSLSFSDGLSDSTRFSPFSDQSFSPPANNDLYAASTSQMASASSVNGGDLFTPPTYQTNSGASGSFAWHSAPERNGDFMNDFQSSNNRGYRSSGLRHSFDNSMFSHPTTPAPPAGFQDSIDPLFEYCPNCAHCSSSHDIPNTHPAHSMFPSVDLYVPR